jgi:hypothetical protein
MTMSEIRELVSGNENKMELGIRLGGRPAAFVGAQGRVAIAIVKLDSNSRA